MSMFQKLEEVEVHFSNIENQLNLAETVSNQVIFQKLSKERASLEPVVASFREYRSKKKLVEENEALQLEETGELQEMARLENEILKEELLKIEEHMKVLLLPRDPNDDKNIMLEIRAGAGGDEAGIFVGDLYKMYTKYAESKRWSVEVMEINSNDVGGYKDAILMIRGDRVYSYLKHESGVHRVQRVPKTETQGRIHTSTVTVAVLPEAEDIEINIDVNDLRIDVFRSSGPGGQSVNTTDSAVRVTHIPTGLVVVCRDEKSQHKNKSKAIKILKTRLLDKEQSEQHEKMAAQRSSQVGTGDRSEKIRTYNFPQGRVTDHRIGVTLYQLDDFMGGEIGGLISSLTSFYQAELLNSQTANASR